MVLKRHKNGSRELIEEKIDAVKLVEKLRPLIKKAYCNAYENVDECHDALYDAMVLLSEET